MADKIMLILVRRGKVSAAVLALLRRQVALA
jgi:hypothetical protein